MISPGKLGQLAWTYCPQTIDCFLQKSSVASVGHGVTYNWALIQQKKNSSKIGLKIRPKTSSRVESRVQADFRADFRAIFYSIELGPSVPI